MLLRGAISILGGAVPLLVNRRPAPILETDFMELEKLKITDDRFVEAAFTVPGHSDRLVVEAELLPGCPPQIDHACWRHGRQQALDVAAEHRGQIEALISAAARCNETDA
jgi:hypothetical protein